LPWFYFIRFHCHGLALMLSHRIGSQIHHGLELRKVILIVMRYCYWDSLFIFCRVTIILHKQDDTCSSSIMMGVGRELMVIVNGLNVKNGRTRSWKVVVERDWYYQIIRLFTNPADRSPLLIILFYRYLGKFPFSRDEPNYIWFARRYRYLISTPHECGHQ
jgi:hypothetical protein